MGEEQQKWVTKLLGFDFKIRYKLGKDNSATDALSRQMQCMMLTTIHCSTWEGLDEEVQADLKLKIIVQDLIGDANTHGGYQLKKGRLFYKERIVPPKNSPRMTIILHEFHDSAVGGHSGYFRTYTPVISSNPEFEL